MVPSTLVVAVRNGRARAAATSIPVSTLAVAVLTFSTTPAGALRSFLPVHIYDGDQLIFSGWVTDLKATSEAPLLQRVDVTAQSLYYLAQTAVPTEVLEQMPIGAAMQLLLAYGLPGATLADLSPGPTQLYAVHETDSLDTIVRDLLAGAVSQNTTGVLDFDEQMAAVLSFSGSFPAAPDSLSDASPVTGNYPR